VVPAVAASAVVVQRNGISINVNSVTISGAQVQLNLAGAIQPADTVNVFYNAPTPNLGVGNAAVQDSSGNDAAALGSGVTGQAVVNNASFVGSTAKLQSSTSALNQGRRHHHRDVRHAPLQGGHHVVPGGCAQRSHHANDAGLRGQNALVRRVEQALGFELGFQTQKLLKQSALPGPFHGFDDQLQVASGFVHAQTPPNFDQFAIARGKVHQTGCAPKHGAADLARVVLDGKIAMTAGCPREARNLAAHRDWIELGIERVSHGAAQRRNCPRTGLQIVIQGHWIEVLSALQRHFRRQSQHCCDQVLHKPGL
jgi:hypothetical protein